VTSRGFWRAPRRLVLLVEDGKINIGDLGLLTLIALDGGERDGFHVVRWGALAATAGESERHMRRRLERLRKLDLVQYDEPGHGGRKGFRIFLGANAVLSEQGNRYEGQRSEVMPRAQSDTSRAVTGLNLPSNEASKQDETSPSPTSTETEKEEKNRDRAASMTEERANSSLASDRAHGGDAFAGLVRNLRDADEWTERTFRKLYGHLPQHQVAQVLHELRKRRTRTDLEPLRSESSWAHDKLRRLVEQHPPPPDEEDDLPF
jgi:hypothetical protein